MYPITTAGLAALRNNAVQSIKIACTPTSGEAFDITEKDLIGECSVEWSSVTGSKLEIGSACMSEMTFTLENADGRFADKLFEGAQLYVTVSFPVSASSDATVPIGYYVVDSPPRKLRSIKITAYDRMARFNKAYDSELAYPATLYQIVEDACSKCGVSCKLAANTLNGSVSVPARPSSDNLTYRQVIIWAAELMGVCLYIDYDGKLGGKWYTTSTKHTSLLASDRFTSGNTDYGENNITFTGVRIVANDENKTEYLAGTKDYAFNIEGNMLVQDGMNISDIATKLKNSRCSLSYRTMSCQTHSFPHLRPLDILTFESGNLSAQTALTNVKWSLNRNSKLESKGETATKAGYATTGAFTSKQQAVIEQARAQTQAQISNMEQAALSLNETIANSLGLYVTQKADGSGALITYYHDQATLENSNTIYCRNAGGYAWTNDGWNNGSPNWQYGVSKDGDAVMRSIAANKISASYITTDILASPTGKFSFNLDTGEIIASDVKITGGNINLNGGSLSIVNTDGYRADLSDGRLGLYQGAGSDTETGYEYLILGNSLLLNTALTGDWYATIAAPEYEISGVSSAGIRIGSSTANAYTGTPVSDLNYNWNTDYMLIEPDATRVRKTIKTNEAGYNVAAGLRHFRSVNAALCNSAFGLGVDSTMGSSQPTAFMEINNAAAELLARLDVYQNSKGGCRLTLRGSSRYDILTCGDDGKLYYNGKALAFA